MLVVVMFLGRELALFLFDEFACMFDGVIDVDAEVLFAYPVSYTHLTLPTKA